MTYSTYEFTAFTEADLLEAGAEGSGISCGDTFTMPADATTCISVSDNDSFLSGDSVCNENSNDSYGQHATITGENGEALGNGGQIYAECYWWVYDQYGNWYVMVEIEQEGVDNADYFTFYTGSGYETPPEGAELTVDSSCNVTSDWIDYKCLDAGEKTPDPGWIKGRLTLDADCNDNEWNDETGQWDEGIAGQTVQLLDLDGNVVAESVTDSYGNYMFDVAPGQYRVKFPLIDGFKFSAKDSGVAAHYDSDADENGLTDIINVSSGQTVANVDAGVKPATGSISGRVFSDEDCDGVDGGTTVVAGCDYTIEAEDMQKYGFKTVYGDQASGGKLVKLVDIQAGGDLATTFSGKDGVYDLTLFAQDETDGQSYIKVKVNGQLVDTIHLDRDSDGVGNNNGGFSAFTIEGLELNAGDKIVLWAGGDGGEYVRIDKILLEGRDEVVQTEEPGREGVVVVLLDADGDEVLDGNGQRIETVTDADGNYHFDNVREGDYRVKFENPDGTEFTFQNVGSDDAVDSDVDGNGVSDVVTVVADQTTSDVDAGLKPIELGSIAGRYFCDDDRDDTENDGAGGFDAGLGGVTVRLLDADGNEITTTVTDSNGGYIFTNLAAGDYRVAFDADPAGKTFVNQDVGAEGEDSDVNAISGITDVISLGAGEDRVNIDAGVEEVDPGEGGDCSFFIQGPVLTRVMLDELSDGSIKVTVDVLDATGQIGDLRGVFFEMADESLLPLLNIAGADVGNVVIDANNVTDVGNGSNVNGEVVRNFGEFDVGVEIGTPGATPDDIRSTMFTIARSDGIKLEADDFSFTDFGIRLTSVGEEGGERGESLKIGGTVPLIVCEKAGSISGTYFCDDDRDGVDDGAPVDPDVAGQTVTLLNVDGTPALDFDGNEVQPVLTGANGDYRFDNLAAGDYVVMFTEADGKAFIAPNVGETGAGDVADDSDVIDLANGKTGVVSVVEDQETTDVDAGVADLLGSISGRYFCDENRDGTELDAAGNLEAGVAGAKVWLIKQGSGVIASTMTDDDGNYSFGDLVTGNYSVRFEDPADVSAATEGKGFIAGNQGDDDAIDSDVVNVGGAGNGNTATFTLAPGEDKIDVDGGIEDLPGSISGTYFCDDDRDGVDGGADAGDADIAGKTVMLLNVDGTQATDIDGNPVAAVLTDEFGDYSFGNLGAGDYVVMFEATEGKSFIAADQGGDDRIDSDVDGNGKVTVSVEAGKDTGDVDAGVSTDLGSLSGRYFCDDNRDGLDNDGADNGVQGVLVELLDAAGMVIDDTLTGADGSYSFDGLVPGTYGVKFTDTVSGKVLTTQNVDMDASDDIDSDAADLGNGMSQILGIEVLGNEDTPNNDAGVVEEAGSLSGTYFCDDNRNGVDDAGDADVAGKTVMLFEADGTTPARDIDGDLVEAQVTDGNGDYSFTNLAAGAYVVMFASSDAEGKEFIAPNVGETGVGDVADDSDVVDAANGKTAPVTVVSGEETTDVDAGVQDQAGSISGTYFCDDDRDGVDGGADAGDADIAGKTVMLLNVDGTQATDIDGNPVAAVLTDEFGDYSFGNLGAGDYVVMFEATEGKSFIAADQGGDDRIDSDVDGNGKVTVSVEAGKDTGDVDAGVSTDLGSLSGRYFCDDNRDGLDNDGADNGVQGVLVELLDAAGMVIDDTLTGADGSYSFDGLVPGTYGVKFTDTVSGKVLTTQNVDMDASDDIDSDAADLGNGMSQILGIEVLGNEDTPNNDAGVVEEAGSLSGTYFCDDNRNGVDDAGDADVAGKTVMLFEADGTTPARDIDGDLVEAQVTDGNGDYSFTNLAAGAYVVMFASSDAEGKEFIAPNVGETGVGDVADDSDVVDAANGKTAPVTVVSGEETTDVDAGVQDQAGSLSGRYFCDEDKNGFDDDGADNGVAGKLVTLLNADGSAVVDIDGAPVDPVLTDDDGNYSFGNLAAGTYSVRFTEGVLDKVLTEQNAVDGAGVNNDAIDSDAMADDAGFAIITDIVVLPGANTPDNDIGVKSANTPPEAEGVAAAVCADDMATINLLDAVSDPDGDMVDIVSISDADETAGIGESITLESGGVVTLNADGTVTFDPNGAYDDLVIRDSIMDQFQFTAEDENGALSEPANADIKVCGALNTIETIAEGFVDANGDPLQASYRVDPVFTGAGFDLPTTVTAITTTNERLEAILGLDGEETFDDDMAYCVDVNGLLEFAVDVPSNLYIVGDDAMNTGNAAIAASVDQEQNLDIVTWILNQGFQSLDAGTLDDGDLSTAGTAGRNYTRTEVQDAIWFFTDGEAVDPSISTGANSQEIIDLAMVAGEGFVAGEGDKVAVLFDPIDEDRQTYVIGVEFDALKEDCDCIL